MKPYLVLTCLGLIMAGCSTTYDIPRNPLTDGFGEASEDVEGRTIQILRRDSAALELDSASLFPDTIVGYLEETAERVAIPLKDVKEIAVYNLGRGVGRGALQGMAIATPWVLLFAVPPPGGRGWLLSENSAAMTALFGVGSGIVIGGCTGAASFSTYHYTFDAAEFQGLESNKDDDEPTKMLRLWVMSFQDETPSRVCIAYGGKLVWLPKSRITIEQDGDRIKLTVPAWMLGVE